MPEEKNNTKTSSVYKAKLAEQAERYEDMVLYMKHVAEHSTEDLSVEERNLLSVAYKNVIGAKRASWRVLTSVKQREFIKGSDSDAEKLSAINHYKKKVELELDNVCEEILNIISSQLLQRTKGSESKVFYHKMSGDYYRYLAEFKEGDNKQDAAESAKNQYESALNAAQNVDTGLPPTHPIRLGLALNYSVFYYEILNQPAKACDLAKKAFDDAIAELDKLQEDSYKDATLIMQLLRDNLTLWTSDEKDDEA